MTNADDRPLATEHRPLLTRPAECVFTAYPPGVVQLCCPRHAMFIVELKAALPPVGDWTRRPPFDETVARDFVREEPAWYLIGGDAVRRALYLASKYFRVIHVRHSEHEEF